MSARPKKPTLGSGVQKVKLPDRLIRLVLQMEDTPRNRKMMENAQNTLTRCPMPLDTHCILKIEQIHVVVFEKPQPPPSRN